MKRFSKIVVLILLICFETISLCACSSKNDNSTMLLKDAELVSATIWDNRSKNSKKVQIKDSEKLKILSDKLKSISGTEMDKKLMGNFPNQSYVPDYPSAFYFIEIDVDYNGNKYSYKIYGGRRVPIISPGTFDHVTGYTDDFDYIAKEDNNKSFYYENTKCGLTREFYTQFYE